MHRCTLTFIGLSWPWQMAYSICTGPPHSASGLRFWVCSIELYIIIHYYSITTPPDIILLDRIRLYTHIKLVQRTIFSLSTHTLLHIVHKARTRFLCTRFLCTRFLCILQGSYSMYQVPMCYCRFLCTRFLCTGGGR